MPRLRTIGKAGRYATAFLLFAAAVAWGAFDWRVRRLFEPRLVVALAAPGERWRGKIFDASEEFRAAGATDAAAMVRATAASGMTCHDIPGDHVCRKFLGGVGCPTYLIVHIDTAPGRDPPRGQVYSDCQ